MTSKFEQVREALQEAITLDDASYDEVARVRGEQALKILNDLEAATNNNLGNSIGGKCTPLNIKRWSDAAKVLHDFMEG